METLWKIVFYILNFAVYLFLIWWVVNKYLVATMAAASLGYWIFFFVLIFLAVSSVGYWAAHYLWNNGYWGMFFKNVGMFFLALFVLYIKVTVPISFSDFRKNGTEFEWSAGISGSKYYTVENVRTDLICSDKGSVSVLARFPSVSKEWGTSGSLEISSGKRSLPTQLYTKWISCAEGESGQLYEGTFELPYDTILDLFRKGYVYKEPNGTVSHWEYSGIVVGLAPGGVVALWVDGSHRRVQVGCWVAGKLPADNEIFASWGGQKERVKQLLERKSNYIPDYIKNQTIPEKQWGEYCKRYSWRYKIEFEGSDVKIIDIETEYYNGELYHLYPLDDSLYHERACPKQIYIGWAHDGNRYKAYIQFDKKYMFSHINKLNEIPNSKMDFIFNINTNNNMIDCYLSNQIDTIEFPDKYRKIKLFMNAKEVYSNYSGEGRKFEDCNYD